MATVIFLCSVVFIFYVLLGYPLLLDLAARIRTRPIKRNLELKQVSILLTVFNGEKWIADKLRSIRKLDYPPELMQIIVISDGSTDRTADIAWEFAGVEVIEVARGGKSTALNAGIQRAHGDILFFTDVRQPLHPACLRSLVGCLGDPQVGAACGHIEFIGDDQAAHMGMYWRYEKWIRNNQTKVDSILAGTGCIQVVRRDLAIPLPAYALLDDSYLPMSAFLRGYRFVLDQGAIAYEYPTSLDTEFHRKVRTLAGIYQLVGFLPGLLGPSNRMWLHFVSYKFARLLVPFAFLAMAAASFWLPAPFAAIALSAQALFYAIAIVDLWIPPKTLVKRLTSVVHTFVVMTLASLFAVRYFFVEPRELWKDTQVQDTQVSTPNR